MYELGVIRSFASAHQLLGYQGNCEELHGHTYSIEVTVRTETLDEIGLAFDFHDLKAMLDRILETYDHKLLNKVPPYDRINPSAENMARTVYQILKPQLPPGVALAQIKIWESDNAWAAYSEP
jgi:6-pyruvoyltetrahydropterin/6-carboxytetrahydropterin synthase